MERTDAPIQRHAPLLLEGGSEFTGRMEAADRAALKAAGQKPVTIVPAAAVPEGGQAEAGRNGVRWFKRLGAADVRSTGWVDRQSCPGCGNRGDGGGIRPGFPARRLSPLPRGGPPR